MNNSPQVFNFKGRDVRATMADDQPWWVAKDVCEALEISDHLQAVSRLDGDEKGAHTIPTPGGDQVMATVNESGLYCLILRSRKKSAREFKRWLTHDVLPSIRTTGSYTVAPLGVTEIDRLAATVNSLASLLGSSVIQAQATAIDAARVAAEAKVTAEAAVPAAIDAMQAERDRASDLRRDLLKAVERLVDEALRRGFFDGKRRSAFQAVNSDIRDRFGVRDAMSSNRLALAVAYVIDRHEKLVQPIKIGLEETQGAADDGRR